MKITTKSRYGLRAILELAMHYNGDYLSLSSIAQRQKISLDYLEHSFAALKKAGIVVGQMGSRGGYKLHDHPANITIEMIINVLKPDWSIVNLDEQSILQGCLNEMVWNQINKDVRKLIAATTLQDLINEYKESENSGK